MTLLRDALADTVRRAARGSPERLATLRPLAEWAEMWQSLTHIPGRDPSGLTWIGARRCSPPIALLNGP